MRVKEMMSIDPVCATPETPLPKIAAMMVEHHCGAIPIVTDGRIAGIVTSRDITCRTLPHKINPLDGTANDVMTREVITINEEETAKSAARIMERTHIRRLPVVSTEGRVVGMLSATDVARMAPKVAHHVPTKASVW